MNPGTKKMITCFENGSILLKGKLVKKSLWMKGGVIVSPQANADVVVNCRGKILAPGFIDIQINGAYGVDFTTEPHRIHEVALKLPAMGVTSFLPTIITTEKKRYDSILDEVQKQMTKQGGAEILGVHLEGPFLSKERKGAHPEKYIQQSDGDFLAYPIIKIMTVDPDNPVTKALVVSDNTILAAGHTNAQFLDIRYKLVTHLFNAMRPLHHRKSGIARHLLAHSQGYYSIIADGEHVHPDMLKIAYKCHPKGMILISDAMAGCGMLPGDYTLGQQDVTITAERAHLKNSKTLAGSILPMDKAVIKLCQAIGSSFPAALETASLHPAELLGLEHKGRLEPGCDADIVIFNSNMTINNTYVKGKKYCKDL